MNVETEKHASIESVLTLVLLMTLVEDLLNAIQPDTRLTVAVYQAMRAIHLLPVKLLAADQILSAQITEPAVVRIVSILVCTRTLVPAMLTV